LIRAAEPVFIDTGAWIAVAVAADPHHEEAAAIWTGLLARGAKPVVSVPVAVETFTYLQRKVGLPVAQAWQTAAFATPRLSVVDCTAADLKAAWPWLERKDLHKLGIVDALSFVVMKRHKLRYAFTFDAHFHSAGFKVVRQR
jgi:predicted nucleic acid-binding protein